MIEHFGSGLALSEVLADAIKFAEHGYPVSELTAELWKNAEAYFQQHLPESGEFLLPSGNSPRAGDLMKFPGLAKYGLFKLTELSVYWLVRASKASIAEKLQKQ
jgi:gamma-glutamyltranspeptidase/glutathione hydrolase